MPRLYIALPVINENELLPRLIKCIPGQTFRDFTLFICVNQPDEWWDDPELLLICEENQKTLAFLKTIRDFQIVIIDKSSKGEGWKGKRHGVGWARKTLMDAINEVADARDLIMSIDADTTFSENYFQSLINSFRRYPDATGIAVPYFHKPVEDEHAYRAILRYEIYMRHYSINLWRIESPYAFTALGSAMAFPVWAYRMVGGMTPKMSGEDFYFLQKLRKAGNLISWNEEKVYPEARFSGRVYFGTGPAMIRGNQGDWTSYPIYRWQFFEEIKETCDLFPYFFRQTQSTRVTEFLRKHSGEDDPFEPLRRNFSSESQFVRACHEKFDGLRILQYLKSRQKEEPAEDEESLFDFINRFYPVSASSPGPFSSNFTPTPNLLPDRQTGFSSRRRGEDQFSFECSSLEELENIRMFLLRKEEEYQITSVPG